jgi:hypothetical protein
MPPLRDLVLLRLRKDASRSPHVSARAQTLAARVGRWLLPWVCAFALSGTLAHAADQALIGGLVEQPSSSLPLAEPLQRAPAAPGLRWMVLSSTDALGARMSLTCLTAGDRVTTDVLELRPQDFDGVAGSLCAPSSYDRSIVSEGQ